MDLSRVVDVSARKPTGGFSFGSGYLIAPGLVLTARHVTCADSGEPFDDVNVRCLEDSTAVPCRVLWPGRPDLDIALLKCPPDTGREVPMRWGRLIGSQAGISCEAVGFPRSMRQDDGLRDAEHLRGQINSGTGVLGGRMYVDVTSAAPTPGTWDGMSGAALWCGPLLTGVIAYDPDAFASRRLAAEPVERLIADPEVQAILGGSIRLEPAEMARPKPELKVPGPAYLLRPEAQTARFRSRAAELADLIGWSEGPGVRVQLLTGPGGQGKTRLAQELAARLSWTSVWLPEGTTMPSGIRHPLLVIMDYAETRRAQVSDVLLAALAEPGHVPIRVLLIARSGGDWWKDVRKQTSELDQGLAGTLIHELTVLEDSEGGRRQAFADALHDYGEALTAMDWPHVATSDVAWPDFRDPRLGSALRLQMTVLAGLLGRDYPDELPEDVILRHEARYWDRTAGYHGISLHEDTLRNAVGAVVLCGAASEPAAMELLSHVRGLRDQTEDIRLRGARWLRDLYPPQAKTTADTAGQHGECPYWGSLQPDLLAEHLVAGIVEAVPGFLDGLLAITSGYQDQQALTVLSRASLTHESVAQALAGLLLRLPKLAPQAADVATQTEDPAPLLGALKALIEQGNPQTELLLKISSAIPENTQSLARFAVNVEQMILADYVRQSEVTGEYSLDLVMAWNRLSDRLSKAGRPEQALAAIERSATLLEQLAEAEPLALPSLAPILNNLSGALHRVGRRDEALAAIQRAVEIRERLSDTHAGDQIPDLAGSLGNLAAILGDMGRMQESQAEFERAVALYEQLEETGFDVNVSTTGLAMTLTNQSELLSNAGRWQEALAAAQRAVGFYERLSESKPDAWLPGLARSLALVATRLMDVGRHGEALVPIDRAVNILEQLDTSLPDAHLPELASALKIRAGILSGLGRAEQALIASRRAVTILERLADSIPGTHLPELASSLNALAIDLNSVGRQEEALAASERAIQIYEQLVVSSPDAYLPDLAMTLVTLSSILSPAGRIDDGCKAIERAATIYERLSENSPGAYEEKWAGALNNLALFQRDVGRHDDALASAQHAVALAEPLAAALPDAYLPHLAMYLDTLGSQLQISGSTDDGVAAGKRAVELYEQAAARNGAYFSELAQSLRNLSVHLGFAGRPEEALAAIQRAVSIYERLETERPGRNLLALATALRALAGRLTEAGRSEEALAHTKQAVGVYDEFTPDEQEKHAGEVAETLDQLSLLLADAELNSEALAALQRAVPLYVRLAAEDRDRYLSGLGKSLINTSTFLSKEGRYDEGIQVAQQGVRIYEELAALDSETYPPNLASALLNLSLDFARSDRRAEALEAAQRAVDMFGLLAETNSSHLPGFARSLNNLSVRLGALSRKSEAISASKRSVELNQRLEEISPGAHLFDLAKSFNNLGANLYSDGQRREAFVAAQDTVNAFQRLIEAGNTDQLATYIATLGNMSVFSVTSQKSECVAAISRAVEVCERLAQVDPVRLGPDVAASLTELGDQLLHLDSPVDAVSPLISASNLAARHGLPDVHARVARLLFRAQFTQPESVAARIRQLTSRTTGLPTIGASPEVEAAIGTDELERLRRDACGDVYSCWMCGRRGVTSDPTNLIVELYQSGGRVLHFSHAGCAEPQIVEASADVPHHLGDGNMRSRAIAVSFTAGTAPEPILLLEGERRIWIRDQSGQLVDAVLMSLIKRGMTQLTAADQAPGPAPGWTLRLGQESAQVLDPDGRIFYDGACDQSSIWRALVRNAGACKVLFGEIGLYSSHTDFTTAAEVRAALGRAARSSELVGGLVMVETSHAERTEALSEKSEDVGSLRLDQQTIELGHIDGAADGAQDHWDAQSGPVNVEVVSAATLRHAIDSGDPDEAAAAALRLGDLLAEEGDTEAARAAYQRAIDSEHLDWSPGAAVNLGALLAESGRAQAACTAYQRAIDSGHPEASPVAAYNLALLLEDQDDPSRARAAYQHAIDSGRDDIAPQAALHLGDLLGRHEDVEGARAAYLQAIDSGGNIAPLAALRLADLLGHHGDVEGARAAYQQAIDSGGHDVAVAARGNLGSLLHDDGDTEGARVAYQEVIEAQHPDYTPLGAYNLGILLAEQGETQDARVAYQLAIDSGHNEWAPQASFNLGNLLEEQGDVEGARAAYQQAANAGHPEASPAAAFNLANILYSQGDIEGAKTAYQKAIDSGNKRAGPVAAINLGNLLARRGDTESARAAYQLAIDSRHPDHSPAATLKLGDLLAEQGDAAGAQAAYLAAIDSGHSDKKPKAALRLGILLEVQGNKESARTAYQLAIDSGRTEASAEAAVRLRMLSPE